MLPALMLQQFPVFSCLLSCAHILSCMYLLLSCLLLAKFIICFLSFFVFSVLCTFNISFISFHVLCFPSFIILLLIWCIQLWPYVSFLFNFGLSSFISFFRLLGFPLSVYSLDTTILFFNFNLFYFTSVLWNVFLNLFILRFNCYIFFS